MISIRNFRKSDIDNQYLSWVNNSKNMKFSRHYNKRYTLKNSEIFYKKIKKKKNFFFLIEKKKLDKVEKVGTMIGHVNKKKKSCNLGILIGKKRKGYGLIAWKKAMKLIFKRGYKKIIGGTQLRNKPMIKIFKNSNMKYEKKKFKLIRGNSKKIYIVFYYKLSNLI